jgi:hypothetical protein
MKTDFDRNDKSNIPQATTYYASQKVPQTGLYRVFHYQHRLPHDAVIRKGEIFPACDKCGKRVMFALSSTAEPLFADLDFMVEAA